VTAGGKEFRCWKFRTMVPDAEKRLQKILDSDPEAAGEWQKGFKLKDDQRITKIGRFLRKASLDELPQFFNVLKGDMSIVGARPVVSKELYDYYHEEAGLYCSIKPGITGLWQVGKRNDIVDYGERVKADIWYIQHLSPWMDLKIIAKTAWRVIRPNGAY
jgi:lipopolysaccharide/colanic/teichoic acid biosynthesis glycosyltransferase